MPARRLRCGSAISALVLLLAVSVRSRRTQFDDEEARRQVNDLSIKVRRARRHARQSANQLVNQIQFLREDNAKAARPAETLSPVSGEIQNLDDLRSAYHTVRDTDFSAT